MMQSSLPLSLLPIALLLVTLSKNAPAVNAFVPSSALTSSLTTPPLEPSPLSTLVPPLAASLSNTQSTPIFPPPPISMPVWSLSCPIPFPTSIASSDGGSSAPSSMSILTFATPVSVSPPKLWAISLYKTSLTRCAFLGIPTRGDEYNDIASISSSVTGTTSLSALGSSSMVRRVRSKSGISGMDDVEGTAGWRMERERGRRGLFSGSNSNLMGGQMNGSEGAGGGGGVGILQLLAPSQSKLVPILGQHSGWEDGYDKRQECAKVLDVESGWISILGSDKESTHDVLPNCASYLQIKLKRVTDGGDHDVAICEVTGTGFWDNDKQTVLWLDENSNDDGQLVALDSSSALYSGQLRQEGII